MDPTVQEIVSTAVRLAVASGLLSWPVALAVVLAVAILAVLAPVIWKAIPSGVFFPRVDVPPPNVAPPIVVSPDGTIPLNQTPPDFGSPS